jgi:triphosphoribosyl-dephospho-CoA synthase
MEQSLQKLPQQILSRMSPGRLATLVSLLEISAPKPGNVHRGADFEDVTFGDFVLSAVVLGDSLDRNQTTGCGETILDAVRSIRATVGTNTNLGIVLLLVPLAKCAARIKSGDLTRAAVSDVLAGLDERDCRLVYEAINLASPGGLGQVAEHDVHECPPSDLIAAMSLAADRDLVARQYSNGFEQVFGEVVSFLAEGRDRFKLLSQAIVFAHVKLMAAFPDSLIARKNGLDVALHSGFLASKCIDAVDVGHQQFWSQVGELDFWLRSDGHRRNPGTTADLITAGLFVAIRNGQIEFASTRESLTGISSKSQGPT